MNPSAGFPVHLHVRMDTVCFNCTTIVRMLDLGSTGSRQRWYGRKISRTYIATSGSFCNLIPVLHDC